MINTDSRTLSFPFRRVRARDTRGRGASPQERVWKPFLATRIRVEFGPLGNPSIVTVIWPSLRHGRPASTVQQRRERDRLAVRDGQHALKSDPGPRAIRNDWVTALLVALQLVMLVLLLTGQIR